MNKKLNLYIISTLAILIMAVPALSQKLPGGFRPEEAVCKMAPGGDIEDINNAYGTVIKKYQPQTDCYLLATPPGHNPDSLANVIDQRPDVEYCRVNYLLTAPEPFQRSQPFLDVECIGDITLQTAAVNLELEDVHAIAVGENVTIGLLDVGVNFTHPEFSDAPNLIVSRYDYIDNDSLAVDEPGGSGSGHGTFIAGLLHLMAPGAQINVYRVLDTTGTGDGYSIASAVLQAVADSCKIINLSFGMIGIHNALDDALKFARDNDIITVAAAGNDSTDDNLIFPFPADRMYCLAVAATDSQKIKADFSNYGEKIDLCAPGTQIYGPWLDTLYGWWDGTSFAAPFVAGAAALLRSLGSTISRDILDSAMRLSAINLDYLNPDYAGLLGSGLIDIKAAMRYVVPFETGDINGDININALDITYLINYLYKGGLEPLPLESGDVNDDAVANALDVTHLINFLYKDGPPPIEW